MDYADMKRPELEAARKRLEADLEDLEEMTRFHFANTSAHINAQEVKREAARLQRYRDGIEEIDRLLEAPTKV